MNLSAINGYTGVYDSKVQNPSIRYGMNAASNMQVQTQILPVFQTQPPSIEDPDFVEAVESFAKKMEQDEFTPFETRYKYSTPTEDGVEKLSLLGAAYEEMGQKTSIPVEELNQQFETVYGTTKEAQKSPFDTKVLDTNNNNKVEVEEYGSFLALSDIKSKDKTSEDTSIMDGTITDEGVQTALSYLAVNHTNPVIKTQLITFMQCAFTKLQNSLGLDSERAKFDEQMKKENLNFLA